MGEVMNENLPLWIRSSGSRLYSGAEIEVFKAEWEKAIVYLSNESLHDIKAYLKGDYKLSLTLKWLLKFIDETLLARETNCGSECNICGAKAA